MRIPSLLLAGLAWLPIGCTEAQTDAPAPDAGASNAKGDPAAKPSTPESKPKAEAPVAKQPKPEEPATAEQKLSLIYYTIPG